MKRCVSQGGEGPICMAQMHAILHVRVQIHPMPLLITPQGRQQVQLLRAPLLAAKCTPTPIHHLPPHACRSDFFAPQTLACAAANQRRFLTYWR